ncbi:hypothetical protein [Roseovarius sp. THAF8]|uniref:hypothetical protein n=1 Tax=Roseovarius sp. THAF8 TaxID=2587846 RepID=UPI00126812F2|nr:hypothetical protein [Roseovarius sp. THAF8]
MEWIIAIGTVLAAVLSSSVVAAFVANQSAYKSIAVEAITKERITWLDELRKIAEDFSVAAAEVALAENIDPKRTHELDRLSARLELHLNPEGDSEKAIIRAGNKLISLAKARDDGFRGEEQNFMLETRKLLKAEWNKAKAEAGIKPSKQKEAQ